MRGCECASIDKLLIGVPAVVSGIIMVVTKLIASLIPVLLLLGFWIGAREEPVELNQGQLVALGAGLMAFGGFLVRQFTKFKNRKIQFMKALSENLYFRNLDNDAGVFHHLLDAAEEEEVKEAVLAYHFLRTAERPLTAAELDRRIEDWFVRRWDAAFDFEVDDGVGKLRRLRLVDDDGAGTADGGAAGRGQAPPGPDLGRPVRPTTHRRAQRKPENASLELGPAHPQRLAEPRGLSREVVAFGEVGGRSGGLGVQPCRGRQVAVPLVEVRRDGGVAGQGGVHARPGPPGRPAGRRPRRPRRPG